MGTRLTQNTCTDISNAADAALREVAERFGMVYVRKGGSFNTSEFGFQVCFQTVSDGAVPDSFKTCAVRLGVDPECFGKEFTRAGTQYRITGINTRRSKYPFSAERVKDGRGFKFPADIIKLHLG